MGTSGCVYICDLAMLGSFVWCVLGTVLGDTTRFHARPVTRSHSYHFLPCKHTHTLRAFNALALLCNGASDTDAAQ